MLLSPLVVPHFTVGLGFLILAAQLGLARGFARDRRLPRRAGAAVRAAQRLRLAAQSRSAPGACGREPRRAARIACCSPSRCRCCCPGLVSGWLFAAILSFNEFTASLFVTAQRTQTLPVAMYNYVREYADPSMAAISVMYIVVTATLLTFANVFLGLGKGARTLSIAAERAPSAPAPDARNAAGGRDVAVRLDGVTKRFGKTTALDGVIAVDPPRRVDDAARPIGLRQDHVAQSRRRLPRARTRRDRHRRPARSPISRPIGARSA